MENQDLNLNSISQNYLCYNLHLECGKCYEVRYVELSNYCKIPSMGKWCWKYEYWGNDNLNACGWQMHAWYIHVYNIYLAHLLFCAKRMDTLEHMAWDEVAIAR